MEHSSYKGVTTTGRATPLRGSSKIRRGRHGRRVQGRGRCLHRELACRFRQLPVRADGRAVRPARDRLRRPQGDRPGGRSVRGPSGQPGRLDPPADWRRRGSADGRLARRDVQLDGAHVLGGDPVERTSELGVAHQRPSRPTPGSHSARRPWARGSSVASSSFRPVPPAQAAPASAEPTSSSRSPRRPGSTWRTSASGSRASRGTSAAQRLLVEWCAGARHERRERGLARPSLRSSASCEGPGRLREPARRGRAGLQGRAQRHAGGDRRRAGDGKVVVGLGRARSRAFSARRRSSATPTRSSRRRQRSATGSARASTSTSSRSRSSRARGQSSSPDPQLQQALPYLDRLDYLVAGVGRNGDRTESRVVLGVRDPGDSGSGVAATVRP